VDYTPLSDIELLRYIVGARVAERIYKGALAPLFTSETKLAGRDKLACSRFLCRKGIYLKIWGTTTGAATRAGFRHDTSTYSKFVTET
jgi:hypothetical protein